MPNKPLFTEVRCPSFSPDSNLLATAGFPAPGSPSVLLWSPWTSRLEGRLFAHPEGSTTAAFSPDGAVLCLGGNEGAVSFWNLMGGKEERRFSPSVSSTSAAAIAELWYGSDGKRLLTGTRRGEISIWRTETLERTSTTAAPEDKSDLQAVAWSPDGSRVAVSAATPELFHPGMLEIRNARTLQVELRIAAHDNDIRAIEFSPDGRFLATASHDRTAKLWSVEDWSDPVVLRGHQDFVLSLAFSPDGSRLITGCEDGSCKIWDIGAQEVREMLTLQTHAGKVTDIAFSPDGQFLATAGTQATVRLWPSMSWNAIKASPEFGDTSAKRIELYKRAFWKKRMAD